MDPFLVRFRMWQSRSAFETATTRLAQLAQLTTSRHETKGKPELRQQQLCDKDTISANMPIKADKVTFFERNFQTCQEGIDHDPSQGLEG
eukprot:5496912-Amphidinium_carterae.1